MSEIFVGLLTIWFVLLGLAIVVRQHRRFLRWSWRQIQRPFLYIWRRWKMEIISFAAGIGVAKGVMWSAIFWPVVIAFGIVFGGWFIGLIIARVSTIGVQRYIEGSREIISDAIQYLWRNFRMQIIWFSIGMIASIFV